MNRKQRRADPSNFLNDGVRSFQAGDYPKARRALDKALSADPKRPDVLYLLGLTQHLQDDHQKAAANMAAALDNGLPARPDFLNNAGQVFHAAGRFDDAVRTYRQALQLKPGAADIHNNLGNALRKQGDHAGAAASYRAAIDARPEYVKAHINLADLLAAERRYEEAKSCLERALARAPGDLDALAALSGVLFELCRFQEALETAKRVLVHDAGNAKANASAGGALVALHREDEAFPLLQKAAAAARPDMTTLLLLGDILTWRKSFHAAHEVLTRAMALYPDFTPVLTALCVNQTKQCLWTGLDEITRLLDAQNERLLADGLDIVEPPMDHVARCMMPAVNLQVARCQAERVRARAASLNRRYDFSGRASAPGRLRLGYLSSDFRDHPVGQVIRRLFELHDRNAFEVFAYSSGRDDGSDVRRHLERTADRFVDIADLDDGQTADRIFEDGIDILIDLNGHTMGNRMTAAALRPAPRQVLWLGYPGTSGGDFFDYAIVDRVIAPAEHHAFFSEKLIELPHTYMMIDDQLEISDRVIPRTEEGLPETGFVFASFCGPRKYEPVMFGAWMDILHAVPGSVLWLAAGNDVIQKNLIAEAGQRDVAPERLVFAGRRQSKSEHLARLRLTDLALDTRIFNGHVTTTDYLLAGVPVIALEGGHFASRVSAGLLAAAGVPEMVTRDIGAYKDLAVALATDAARLGEVRQRLAAARHTAPLFDTPQFVRDLEAAYQRIWHDR